MGPFVMRASWASMTRGMLSKEYNSPGMRTNSGTIKPRTANIAVRPCLSSDSRNHGINGAYVSDKLRGSNLNSLAMKLMLPG